MKVSKFTEFKNQIQQFRFLKVQNEIDHQKPFFFHFCISFTSQTSSSLTILGWFKSCWTVPSCFNRSGSIPDLLSSITLIATYWVAFCTKYVSFCNFYHIVLFEFVSATIGQIDDFANERRVVWLKGKIKSCDFLIERVEGRIS